MSEPQKIQLTLSPQAEKYVRHDAPVEARRMAASGALPLDPIELATVLFALVHDVDDKVKTRARESLEGLPDHIANTVLSGATHPAVLSWLAQAWRNDGKKMEQLALNSATDDTTFQFLAGLPHKGVIDIVAGNQTRILRHPDIVDALGENPLTGRATIDRLLSFMGLERPDSETPAEDDDGTMAAGDVTDEAALETLNMLLGNDVDDFSSELIEEIDDEDLDAEVQNNLFALVQKMNVMQKVKLARMGNKEARGLLIRDRNKIVASAAIRSPKITENEVENYAKARNVSDDVLRIISSNRDWTKNYQVKMALSTNPKCPVPTAMKFLNFLMEKDLRNIMKSKDVASPISTQARRILQKKGKI